MSAAKAGIMVVLAVPFAFGEYALYQMSLYFLYAVAAVGVGLCWGQVGVLPLGHALFFGIAAYLAGFVLIAGDNAPWLLLLLPLAALVAGIIAFAIGILVFRRVGESGPYFSMITLALSLLAFQVTTNWASLTGGFDGLKDIPSLPGLDSTMANYAASAAALVAVLAGGHWLMASPLGVLWRAIAQNERRVALFGFNTNLLKAVAFGISGLFAGIGGTIYASQQGFVTPQVVGFGLSAELVIWAAVGGRGSLVGPVIGTLLIGTLTSELRDTFRFWEVLTAVSFIVVVLFFPSGLVGLMDPVVRWLDGKPKVRDDIEAPVSVRNGAPPRRLKIDQVTVRAGEVLILDRLNLDLGSKGISCIIGPNGAGKTSTFNVVSGEMRASQGVVTYGDLVLTRMAAHRIAATAGIGRKLQFPSVFPDLSIAENLAIALWSGRASASDLLRPWVRRWTSPLLRQLRLRYAFLSSGARKASELSHGERQILELSMAILTEPRILLLDEPCAGLSPDETSTVIDVIRWASEATGCAVVIIEHDMSLVLKLADAVYVLHNGTLLARGSVKEIQANEDVRSIYAGNRK